MKNVLFLILIFFSLQAFPQYFTNGSVYDYSVGDTIVTSFSRIDAWGNSYPPTNTYRIFKKKTISMSADTIFYETHRVVESIQGNGMAYTITITAADDTLIVSNLTASIISFTIGDGRCLFAKDTSYIDYCGRHVHLKYLTNLKKDSCNMIEIPTESYTFIEGIGVFTEKISWLSYPVGVGWGTHLVVANKVGKPNCGKVGAIPNGITGWDAPLKINIFPNPSNGKYSMILPFDGTVVIFNAQGSEVFRENISAGSEILHLEKVPPGLYYIGYSCEKGKFVEKLIKE